MAAAHSADHSAKRRKITGNDRNGDCLGGFTLPPPFSDADKNAAVIPFMERLARLETTISIPHVRDDVFACLGRLSSNFNNVLKYMTDDEILKVSARIKCLFDALGWQR